MKNKVYETIIVGAGIAGISCAAELRKRKRPYMLISEDIGGCILTSEDGKVNYGAYIIYSDYYHVLPFVKKSERVNPFDIEFHRGRRKPFRFISLFLHPFQALRLLFLLYWFRTEFRSFRKDCLKMGQLEAFKAHPALLSLYKKDANDFLHEKKIYQISHDYISQGIYFGSFLPLSKLSAFSFLRGAVSLVDPIYEFMFDKKRAKKVTHRKLKIDTAVSIRRGQPHAVMTASGKTYWATNVVVATPPHISKKLLGLKKMKKSSSAHMFHIRGKLKRQWANGQYEFFGSKSEVIFIRKQADGTTLFYSQRKDIDLDEFFEDPEIIFHKYWHHSLYLIGDVLWDSKMGKDIYLIGGHNIPGIEDAAITGIYAARQIIRKKAN